jgi:hypothetical protein
MEAQNVTPFANCPALDGCHCQTNSLAKIFHHASHPLSEEMLLGLSAGQGFFFWQQKGAWPFIGGRNNVNNFFRDLGTRCGVIIERKSTSSVKKARETLVKKMGLREPVMLFGDMAYIPWFSHFPDDYHFGGHTFVICGFNWGDTFLASDIDPKSGGIKKGFYAPITMEQLERARNSPHKPFPPKNTWLEFDFSGYYPPRPVDIYSAIHQTINDMLNPPISNAGVKGIRRTGKEMMKWIKMYDEKTARMILFNIHIFIDIGGTGGGIFRFMYSRFLKEASEITANPALAEISEILEASGRQFSETGKLFKDYEIDYDMEDRIRLANEKLNDIANIETVAYKQLLQAIPPE